MSWASAARSAAMAALRGCRTQGTEIFQQQTRKMGKSYGVCVSGSLLVPIPLVVMESPWLALRGDGTCILLLMMCFTSYFAVACPTGGGGGGNPWYRSYDGKPAPAEFQGPDYVTYAGLTLPKRKKDVDYFYTKGVGALVW